MLDELVRRISEKTGLPEEQARSAAEAAIGFVKEKLPAPIAGQVDNYLGGGNVGSDGGGDGGVGTSSGGGLMGQAQDMIGGMFGGGNKSE